MMTLPGRISTVSFSRLLIVSFSLTSAWAGPAQSSAQPAIAIIGPQRII
jgi:hypothetical protein